MCYYLSCRGRRSLDHRARACSCEREQQCERLPRLELRSCIAVAHLQNQSVSVAVASDRSAVIHGLNSPGKGVGEKGQRNTFPCKNSDLRSPQHSPTLTKIPRAMGRAERSTIRAGHSKHEQGNLNGVFPSTSQGSLRPLSLSRVPLSSSPSRGLSSIL